MYRHILIATDGSELAWKAVSEGVALAKYVGARVTAVTVTELWSVTEMATKARLGEKHPVEAYEESAAALARKVLDSVASKAAAAGVPCDTVHVSDSRPADAILSTCAEKACDLIVLATHGRTGLARILVGSHAAEVIAEAQVPVLVCR